MTELLISMGIFVTMTSFVVSKFGNFNTNTLLTDTAYDVALVVHLAQTYGLSVRNVGNTGLVNFTAPYGVDFSTSEGQGGGPTSNNRNIVLFAEASGDVDYIYDAEDVAINSYLISRGGYIQRLCVATNTETCSQAGASVTRMSISFERPNPEAKIYGFSGGQWVTGPYAEILIAGNDGASRTVFVRQNGQVSVKK